MGEVHNTGGGAYNAGDLTTDGDFVGRDRNESTHNNGRVTIGTAVRLQLPNGQPLEVAFARLETRMSKYERSQDVMSIAILMLSLLLMMQTIWIFSSMSDSFAVLNEKISSINLHIIRIETKMGDTGGFGSDGFNSGPQR